MCLPLTPRQGAKTSVPHTTGPRAALLDSVSLGLFPTLLQVRACSHSPFAARAHLCYLGPCPYSGLRRGPSWSARRASWTTTTWGSWAVPPLSCTGWCPLHSPCGLSGTLLYREAPSGWAVPWFSTGHSPRMSLTGLWMRNDVTHPAVRLVFVTGLRAPQALGLTLWSCSMVRFPLPCSPFCPCCSTCCRSEPSDAPPPVAVSRPPWEGGLAPCLPAGAGFGRLGPLSPGARRLLFLTGFNWSASCSSSPPRLLVRPSRI